METIELKSGIINPEKISALQSDLKSNFYDVRAKYFRADLPKSGQTRPKNIFPSDPGNANFVALKVSRRDCLEFYKAAFRSHAIFYRENFNPDDISRITQSLQRKGFIKPPESPKPVLQPLPPRKNIIEEIFDSVKRVISGIIGNLRK